MKSCLRMPRVVTIYTQVDEKPTTEAPAAAAKPAETPAAAPAVIVAPIAQKFAVAHIYASFNDTFVHITDISGRETIVRITGMII